MKSLVIVYSYHHHNTEKIARAMAGVLEAQVVRPQQVEPDSLQAYDLVGFGSGIYDSKHHPLLLKLADKLPPGSGGKAFLFSTCGVPAFAFGDSQVAEYIENIHAPLREKLQAKGYVILDEFVCPGHNTNSFLKLWGGINKGRPNAQDIKRAESLARRLKT